MKNEELYLQLLKLKDPLFPLLKKMRIKTPGTYFHSLIVSELAASAAMLFKNKANALLAQVGGLYHDIGKIAKPEVYAENQEDKNYPFQPNIIITHVEKSLEIAQAFNLPKEIQKFMATHHGTQSAPQENNIQNNSYPKSFLPQSIEETLVMLADSSEAAVRSSLQSDKDSIQKIIHNVFLNKIENDQLRDSILITYNLDQVEENFVEVLAALYHRRHATEEN